MFENSNNYCFLTVCLTLPIIVNACLWTLLKVLNVMYKEVMIINISIYQYFYSVNEIYKMFICYVLNYTEDL